MEGHVTVLCFVWLAAACKSQHSPSSPQWMQETIYILPSWPEPALLSALEIGTGSRSYCSLLKCAPVAEWDLYPSFSCLAVSHILVVPHGLRLTCPSFKVCIWHDPKTYPPAWGSPGRPKNQPTFMKSSASWWQARTPFCSTCFADFQCCQCKTKGPGGKPNYQC